MRKFLNMLPLWAVLSFALAACNGMGDDEPEVPAPAPHAMLFYFVGTDLDSFFGINIAAAERAVASGAVGNGKIAYFRRSGNNEWAISEISYDAKKKRLSDRVLKRYQSPDLSDMNGYLADMISLVQAESYGLILGGHGTGWLPKGNELRSYSVAGRLYPFGQAPVEGAEVTRTGAQNPATRYFGEEGVMFNIEELAASAVSTGVKFDYIIFDDCFMSNIESLYAMRRAADYIIASPCEIMGAGFPYETVVKSLFVDEGRRHDLEGVCRNFYDYYRNYSIPSGCVAMAVCSELDNMAAAARRLYAAADRDIDQLTLQTYEPLSDHMFFDMMQHAEKISDDESLVDEFRRQFDRTFPESCRLHTDTYYSVYNGRNNYINYYSGVSTSAPAKVYTDEYRKTEWYRVTH